MKRLSASGLLVLSLAGVFGAGGLVHPILIQSAGAQEASVYRWVDAQGIVHYAISRGTAPENCPSASQTTRAASPEGRIEIDAAGSRAGRIRRRVRAEADRQNVLAERKRTARRTRSLARTLTHYGFYKRFRMATRLLTNEERMSIVPMPRASSSG